MNILILEDDKIQATNLVIQLFQLGFSNVLCSDNGISALSLCKDNEFDLIICDINMPHMDGITFLSDDLIREKVKNIIITSVVNDDILNLTKGMCGLLGYRYSGVLKKPFNSQDIKLQFECMNSENTILLEADEIYIQDEFIVDAFNDDMICNVYEPQLDFYSGKIIGVEASARVEHPKFGMLKVSEFSDVLDRHKLYDILYYKVLSKATTELSSLPITLHLSINIPQQSLSGEICSETISICNNNRFPLDCLTLEITEEIAYHCSPNCYANLARLRLNNVNLSIDNFGTGFASLSQLIDLPFNEIKIDKKFVSNVLGSYKLQKLITMILNLSQELGLDCIAEGVDDSITFEYLNKLGLDYCQGGYISAPLSINELSDFIETREFVDSSFLINRVGAVLHIYLSNKDEAYAIKKLLEKNEKKINVIVSPSQELLLDSISDSSVNFIVCDSVSLSEIFVKSVNHGHKYDMTTLLILGAGGDEKEYFKNTHTIIRTKSLQDSVNSIVEKVKKCIENTRSFDLQASLLSKRELAVAKYISAGYTNKAISYELGLSQKTVSTYKKRIMTKLNVYNSVDLIKSLICYR